MTKKEFEVQKALGLAMECDLTVTALTHQTSAQEIKDAVKKHTFTSRCIKEEACYYSSYTGHSRAKLTFEVKCVDNIIPRISAELQPHPVEIKIVFREMRSIEGKSTYHYEELYDSNL